MKENISMQVVLAYLNILNAEDQLTIVRKARPLLPNPNWAYWKISSCGFFTLRPIYWI